LDFQQSQTFVNLQNAYQYELQTSAKFEMFGIKAVENVLIGISYIFNTTSRNNRFIADRLRKLVFGGDTTTLENLEEASADETYADRDMYREYSRIAIEEGFNDIAALFNGIGNIKLNHNLTFQLTANDLRNDELFCKEEQTLWICLGCGNILSGVCAPAICPICGYPQGYYELFQAQ
jgi:rubrerythrin